MVPLVDLLVILGGSAFFILKLVWSLLSQPVYKTPFRLDLKSVSKGFLEHVVEPAFGEEGFFRGIPWIAFLIARYVSGSEVVALLVGLPLFLVLNLGWVMLHNDGPSRWSGLVFLSGLILGGLLFWRGSIFVPIAVHLVWNGGILTHHYLKVLKRLRFAKAGLELLTFINYPQRRKPL